MEMAAPHTFRSDVLHQGWAMIIDRPFKASGQPGDSDVLHPLHFVPMFQHVFDRDSGKEKGLTAKHCFGVDDEGIPPNIASQLSKVGIVQAGQGHLPIFQRLPSAQIVPQESIEL